MHKKLKVFVLISCLSFLSSAPIYGSEKITSVMRHGDYHIKHGETVQDIVIVDGTVQVEGNVQGSINVVGGDILLNPHSRVAGTIYVYQGDIYLDPDAVFEDLIHVFGGKVHGWNPETIENQKGKSPPRVIPKEQLNQDVVELLRRYAVMKRAIPISDIHEKSLKKFGLKELDLSRSGIRRVHNLFIDGLGSFPLLDASSGGGVEQAWEMEFRTTFRKVYVRIVKFVDEKAAEDFWIQLAQISSEELHHSIQINLGEGAHWYFRHEGFAGALWYRDQWLTFVDVEAISLGADYSIWFEAEKLRQGVIEAIDRFYTTYHPEAKEG